MAIFTSAKIVQFFVEQRYFTTSGVSRRVCNSYTYVSTHTGDYIVGSKLAWATSFRNQIQPSIAALLPHSPTPVNIYCWAVNITGDSFTLELNGSASPVPDDRLPLSAAVYVNKNTGVRSRQFTGSMRIGPIRLADVVSDELTAAAITRYITGTSILKASIGNTGSSGLDILNPVVWSRQASLPSVPPAAQKVALVQSVRFDKSVSSWRHRREKTVI